VYPADPSAARTASTAITQYDVPSAQNASGTYASVKYASAYSPRRVRPNHAPQKIETSASTLGAAVTIVV
jgi:hypothetical protein